MRSSLFPGIFSSHVRRSQSKKHGLSIDQQIFLHESRMVRIFFYNCCQIKFFWLDVEYFGTHTVRYCEDGFYEIVGV